MAGNALREAEQSNGILQTLSKRLLTYVSLIGGPSVTHGCLLQGQFDALLQKCKNLEQPPAWVAHFESCTGRFKLRMEARAREWVDLPIEQDSSVSDIAKNIADLQPPSSIKFLHDCIAILKQREFVEKLEVPGETMDHVKVADQVKDMVTIASFNADILKKLMPKHFETVSKFTQMASVNAMAIVDKVTKEYEHIPDIIKKQKPPDRTM